MTVAQRLSFLTIGVTDLQLVKQFYIDHFGWTPLKFDSDGVVFFKLNGFILSLFPLDELAKDAGIPNDAGNPGFKGMSLAYNLDSEKAVDDLVASLRTKGVRIVKAPEKVFWGGYSAYIADVENNLWEIAYNPFMEMDEKGNVIKM